MSINLSDLLSQPEQISRAVSVDTSVLQLLLLIESQESTVYVTFEKPNDFNLVACLLKETGFGIGNHTAPSRWEVKDDRATTSPAPRLSSISPGLFSQSMSTHDTPTNPQVELSNGLHGVNPSPRLNHEPRYPQQPSLPQGQASPVPAVSYRQPDLMSTQETTAQPIESLSPYQVFAQPGYVSSPLRNSYVPQHITNLPKFPEISTGSTSLGFPTYSTECSPSTEILLSPAASIQPNIQTSDWQSPPQQSAFKEAEQPKSSQKPQNYRDLMPPLRSLPFVKEAKNDHMAMAKEAKTSRISEWQSKSAKSVPFVKKLELTAKGGKPAEYTKTADTTIAESGVEGNDNQYVVQSKTASAGCQTDLNHVYEMAVLGGTKTASSFRVDPEPEVGVALNTGRPTCGLPERHSEIRTLVSRPVESKSLLLLADDGFFKEMNTRVGTLLHQFETDVERGLDDVACAQFYMNQILKLRTKMCYDRLVDSKDVV